jgi:hypothetical protein
MRSFAATLLYSLVFTVVPVLCGAQDDENQASKKWCQDNISKKAIALYEKGTDKKKYKNPSGWNS